MERDLPPTMAEGNTFSSQWRGDMKGFFHAVKAQKQWTYLWLQIKHISRWRKRSHSSICSFFLLSSISKRRHVLVLLRLHFPLVQLHDFKYLYAGTLKSVPLAITCVQNARLALRYVTGQLTTWPKGNFSVLPPTSVSNVPSPPGSGLWLRQSL